MGNLKKDEAVIIIPMRSTAVLTVKKVAKGIPRNSISNRVVGYAVRRTSVTITLQR
jgi:hypothetical protein